MGGISNETLVLIGILSFYFMMTSGVIHVLTMKPPAMGTRFYKGESYPVAFKENDERNQYIFEGFAGGAMYMLGALGIMLVSKAFNVGISSRSRQFLVGGGAILFAVAYNLSLVFVRIKIPNYMASQ